jgi:metal-sulfur cluster biosynthetic enzyme
VAPGTDEVRAALRHVIDPEVGIDVVDLGLVYEVRTQGGHVHVVMTMTTAACPLGESIVRQAQEAIRRHVDGVASVSVDLVWEPAWQPSMMSETARARLGSA